MMKEEDSSGHSGIPEGVNKYLIQLDLEVIKHTHANHFFFIREIINKYDPIGLIAIGSSEDEYDPEVKTIVYQLKDVHTIVQIQDLVYQEFLRWFEEKSIVGERDSYAEIAIEIFNRLNTTDGSSKMSM
jgi:hypothetical protein